MDSQPPCQTCLMPACHRPQPSPVPPHPSHFERVVHYRKRNGTARHSQESAPKPSPTDRPSPGLPMSLWPIMVRHYKGDTDMPHLLRVCQCLLDPVALRHIQPLLHCRALHDPVPPGGHVREGPIKFYTCMRAGSGGSAEGAHHVTCCRRYCQGVYLARLQGVAG